MIKEVEDAFDKTTKIIFGRSLGKLSLYEKWLQQNTPGGRFVKSAHGNKTIFLPNLSIHKFVKEGVADALEAFGENSEIRLDIADKDLFSLGREFAKNATLVCEFTEGKNQNVIDSIFYLNAQNMYKIAFCFHSRYCAYNIWSSFNEYTFGCYRNMNSSFDINCYFSTELVRCFEMDACRKCSDAMFCHNCENVHESMFCFNTKNKRYAIGNLEVGKDNYLKMKKKILDSFVAELEKTSGLELNIYNVLCR